jgi:molybdopterin-guanine dinucleotide biosynthesis protein A
MGGRPKGLVPHPLGQGSLIDHVVDVARRAGADPVLVGSQPAYAGLGLPMLRDAREGVGPLGGLESLLREAGQRDAIAVACDMPYVPVELLIRLQSLAGPDVDAVMPRRPGGREPLCALYRSPHVLPHVQRALREGRLGLQAMASGLRVAELVLEGAQARWLDDWDEPEDMLGC